MHACWHVRVFGLILACGARGYRSQIPLLFLGAISAQLSRSMGVCQKESATLPVPCLLTLQHCLPLITCPLSTSLLLPCHIPCLSTYLVPAVFRAQLSTGAARVGQLRWEGPEEREGTGRCCSPCYFELLTEQLQKKTPCSGLLQARPCG